MALHFEDFEKMSRKDLAKWKLRGTKVKSESEYNRGKNNASKKYTTVEEAFVTLKNIVNVMLVISHILFLALIFFHR